MIAYHIVKHKRKVHSKHDIQKAIERELSHLKPDKQASLREIWRAICANRTHHKANK